MLDSQDVGVSVELAQVRWDSKNTITYPLLCAIAGLWHGGSVSSQ